MSAYTDLVRAAARGVDDDDLVVQIRARTDAGMNVTAVSVGVLHVPTGRSVEAAR